MACGFRLDLGFKLFYCWRMSLSFRLDLKQDEQCRRRLSGARLNGLRLPSGFEKPFLHLFNKLQEGHFVVFEGARKIVTEKDRDAESLPTQETNLHKSPNLSNEKQRISRIRANGPYSDFGSQYLAKCYECRT